MPDLTIQQIADATGANTLNVETNWPLVLNALRRFEIAAPAHAGGDSGLA